jgi:hypothetical protein
MAEYYAVLSKAVAGLEANGADTRRAVYDKARNALIGQLKAIDPPLPTAEISRQRLELEEAIRRVEREASTVQAGAPVRGAGARTQAAARAQPEREPKQSPQDVFRRAIQAAERDSDGSPRVERAPVAARADDWSTERAELPPPARRTESYLPSQGYIEEKPSADEPRLAPDYDYEWGTNAAPKPAAAAPPREPTPVVDARDRAGKPKSDRRDQGRGEDPESLARRARPSRLPLILLLGLIAVMIVGLGALGYSQREVIADLLGGFDSKPAAPVVAVKPPVDTSGKDTDSLLGSGSPADQAAPSDNVRVVSPAGSPADNSGAPAVSAASPALPAGPGTAAAPTAGDALVAQKATLYEEPINAAAAATGVVAIKAAVTWSLAQAADGAEIVGNIDVPDRGVKIKLTVRRNVDKTLPASHVVEVVVETPATFPGKGIRDVPRIVMKPAEDARGQPLIGASAKVADGFFWVALSGVDADVTANLRLLKDREWFDLPLVYESGQRAIVTFEKGTAGDRVFEQALAAWTAG